MAVSFLHYADLEAAYNSPEQVGRLVGKVNQLRDAETVVCGGGDNTGPSVLSMVTAGQQALDFYRAVEPDVETFGNHDFDRGIDPLLDVVERSPQTWLCANAVRDGDRFAAAQGAVPWTVVEAGEHDVGLFGVVHPETDTLNPKAADVQFTDPIPAAARCVEELTAEGVDHIAAVSHLGDDAELGRSVDVDVILGAHDHDRRADRIDGTLVCRPGAIGRYLLEVSFEGSPTAAHHEIAGEQIDTGVVDALQRRMDAAGLTDVVGTTADPIYCDMMACKRGESEIGNIITDAYRWQTGADVAVNSGGGFRRREPLQGEVTAFDLVSITPYDSDLLVVEVDGTALLDVLGQLALDGISLDFPDWHFGHVSGASVVWDDAAGELTAAQVSGAAVTPDDRYRVATSEFFVNSDDLFPALRAEDIVERSEPQYEAVVEYVREHGLDPEPMGRIRRPELPADAVPARDWPHSPA